MKREVLRGAHGREAGRTRRLGTKATSALIHNEISRVGYSSAATETGP